MFLLPSISFLLPSIPAFVLSTKLSLQIYDFESDATSQEKIAKLRELVSVDVDMDMDIDLRLCLPIQKHIPWPLSFRPRRLFQLPRPLLPRSPLPLSVLCRLDLKS